MWGVKLLKEEIIISGLGNNVSLHLDWADGMAGALPVFNSKEDALKYAKDENLIFKFVKE